MFKKHRFAGRRGTRAIASVEFAICAPFLLILFLGTVEILMLFRTEAKLNMFAGNMAQMVSLQEAALSSSGAVQSHSPIPVITLGASPPGLADLCGGAVFGLQPFPTNGLTVAIASVTQVTAAPPKYDEWEVDLTSACANAGTQTIGATAAKAIAIGSGSTTSMVQNIGDNIIIVKATLAYPGVLGLILTSAQTLGQTAVARWRYAATTNITNVSATPAPATTLELSCSGSGCNSNYGV